jgi:hypothetical protein
MAESRVTSIAAEVLGIATSQARVSLIAAEILATASSQARVSAIAVEALVSVAEVPGVPPRPTTPSSSWSSAHDNMPGPGPAAFGSTPRSAPGSLSRGVLISLGLRGSSGSLIGGRHHLEACPLGIVHLEACKMTCLRSSRLRSWQFTR